MNIEAEMSNNSATNQGKRKKIENDYVLKDVDQASFNIFYEPINLNFK